MIVPFDLQPRTPSNVHHPPFAKSVGRWMIRKSGQPDQLTPALFLTHFTGDDPVPHLLSPGSLPAVALPRGVRPEA